MGDDLESLARQGILDRKVIAHLDTLEVPMVQGLLGAGQPVTSYAEPLSPSWRQGETRPSLADEDPAVMVAIGRCALARWRRSDRLAGADRLAETVSHPERCGWCDYPAKELYRALDWGVWFGRLITDEVIVWRGADGTAYRRRTSRPGTYENPRWAIFAARSPSEQRYAVDAAVQASRAALEPEVAPTTTPAENEAPRPADRPVGAIREHAPWCGSDHEGACPPPDEEETP